MLKYLRYALVLCLLVMPLAAQAQSISERAQEAKADVKAIVNPEAPKAVDEEALKRLISTLESDTARAELLSNLKLLLEQQAKDETATEEQLAPLTQALGVESFTTSLVREYQAWLARNNLKGSTVGKAGLTLSATLGALIVMLILRRLVTRTLKLISRLGTWLELPPMRLRLYARVLRASITIATIGLIIYTCFVIWGGHTNPFEAAWFKSSLKLVVNIGFVIVLATIVWEGVNTAILLTFRRLDGHNSARAQTIMPIVRNVLFMLFALIFAMLMLSELGVNITPFLAGAGIIGVAVGLGAQSMVKDFLTGFTIILEDVVRVGDVVRVAGHEGSVEKITLRKIQLRDADGRVYTIPFSQITTIENVTKDFSFYPLAINIAYKENTDEVIKVLQQVDTEMRADAAFAGDMLEPIEIFGVDSFADNNVVIKGRMKTQPLRQWAVGREFNRRMKMAFEAHGIEIPFPQLVVTVNNPQDVTKAIASDSRNPAAPSKTEW